MRPGKARKETTRKHVLVACGIEAHQAANMRGRTHTVCPNERKKLDQNSRYGLACGSGQKTSIVYIPLIGRSIWSPRTPLLCIGTRNPPRYEMQTTRQAPNGSKLIVLLRKAYLDKQPKQTAKHNHTSYRPKQHVYPLGLVYPQQCGQKCTDRQVPKTPKRKPHQRPWSFL